MIIKDPYGFEIDPAAARELWDAYRSYWPLVINMSKYLPDKPYWDAFVRFKKMGGELRRFDTVSGWIYVGGRA